MPMGPAVWPSVLRSAEGVWSRQGAGKLGTLAAWNLVASYRVGRGYVRRAFRRE